MNWAHYLLQVNIYLIVFYGFYQLFLHKETYFTLNRIYLLLAGLLSMVVPVLRIEWFTTQPVAQPIYTGVDQLSELVTQVTVLGEKSNQLNSSNIVSDLYLIGVAFFLVRSLFKLYTVRLLLKNATSGSAFSFLRKMVIDKNLPEIQTIEKHEEIHVRQWHTVDLLFFEALSILNWFNPILFIYKRTIKNIHEYLADEAAAKHQGDHKQYALLLLSTAFGVKPHELTNSFFHKSFIKKRIYMLHKQRSKRTAILKYGLFVPLFALALILSSATIRNNQEIQSLADQLPISEPIASIKNVFEEAVVSGASSAHPETKKTTIDNQPTKMKIPALATAEIDWSQFYEHLMRKIKYPVQARETELQGYSYIKFTITNGEIENLGLAGKSLGHGCDAEVMSSILSYNKFERSASGKYILPVAFTLRGAQTPVENEKSVRLNDYKTLSPISVTAYSQLHASTTNGSVPSQELVNDTKIYDFVSIDQQPGFPGGLKKFYEYLSNNLRYPAEAQEKNVQGKVYLSFVIEKNGALTDIKVERKLGSGTDEEAIRVLNESPRWVPGIQDGKPIRVKYNIPISFPHVKR